jgi:hypothetical protein
VDRKFASPKLVTKTYLAHSHLLIFSSRSVHHRLASSIFWYFLSCHYFQRRRIQKSQSYECLAVVFISLNLLIIIAFPSLKWHSKARLRDQGKKVRSLNITPIGDISDMKPLYSTNTRPCLAKHTCRVCFSGPHLVSRVLEEMATKRDKARVLRYETNGLHAEGGALSISPSR